MTFLFFVGVCFAGRYNGAWINVSEYTHTKYKNPVSTFLLVVDQISVIIVSGYFKYEKINWEYL